MIPKSGETKSAETALSVNPENPVIVSGTVRSADAAPALSNSTEPAALGLPPRVMPYVDDIPFSILIPNLQTRLIVSPKSPEPAAELQLRPVSASAPVPKTTPPVALAPTSPASAVNTEAATAGSVPVNSSDAPADNPADKTQHPRKEWQATRPERKKPNLISIPAPSR